MSLLKTKSFILIFLCLSGCALKINQIEPPSYKLWKKTGTSELEIKKAILECGYSTPYYNFFYKKPDNLDSHFCMKDSGFNSPDMRVLDNCRKEKYKNSPSCYYNTKNTKRSISKRLNSPYCKETKILNDPICQP